MYPKFNLRLVGALIILVIIAVTYITDQKYYNETISTVLEWKHLNISIWFGCFICFVLHYLSAKSSNSEYAGLIYVDDRLRCKLILLFIYVEGQVDILN